MPKRNDNVLLKAFFRFDFKCPPTSNQNTTAEQDLYLLDGKKQTHGHYLSEDNVCVSITLPENQDKTTITHTHTVWVNISDHFHVDRPSSVVEMLHVPTGQEHSLSVINRTHRSLLQNKTSTSWMEKNKDMVTTCRKIMCVCQCDKIHTHKHTQTHVHTHTITPITLPENQDNNHTHTHCVSEYQWSFSCRPSLFCCRNHTHTHTHTHSTAFNKSGKGHTLLVNHLYIVRQNVTGEDHQTGQERSLSARIQDKITQVSVAVCKNSRQDQKVPWNTHKHGHNTHTHLTLCDTPTHKHEHTHLHTQTHIHKHETELVLTLSDTNTQTHTHTHTHTHTYTHKHTHVHTHVHTHHAHTTLPEKLDTTTSHIHTQCAWMSLMICT